MRSKKDQNLKCRETQSCKQVDDKHKHNNYYTMETEAKLTVLSPCISLQSMNDCS